MLNIFNSVPQIRLRQSNTALLWEIRFLVVYSLNNFLVSMWLQCVPQNRCK